MTIACTRRASLPGLLVAVGIVFSMGSTVAAQADAPMPNPPEFPFENPPLADQDTLGKLLFWDEQLSIDNTMACGTCHLSEAGGSDPRAFKGTHPGPDGLFGFFLTGDDIAGSPGTVSQDVAGFFVKENTFFPGPEVTPRKAPSVINAVYFDFTGLMWDGRADVTFIDPVTQIVSIGFGGAVESATAICAVDPVGMGGTGWDWTDIQSKVSLVKPMALATNLTPEMQALVDTRGTYPAMMEAVYGSPGVTSERIIFSIANYVRTLISDETVLDDFLKGDIAVFPPEFDAGFQLFQGEAQCASCHTLPFTADADYHNIGVRPDAEDIGRQAVTLDPGDIARFKTPNVRNAKLRGTLFHNGEVDGVAALVDFYDQDVKKPGFGENVDDFIFNLYLSQQEKADLVFFLEEGTTDARVENAQFPFSRPTLRSELPSLNTVFGVPSANGAGVLPVVIAHMPLHTGNANFLLGVDEATPLADALVAFSWAAGDGLPFTDPAFPIPMNVDFGTLFLFINAVIDAEGVGTIKLIIPPEPLLIGVKFYAQWFIEDAAAIATGGIYGSEGVELEIF